MAQTEVPTFGLDADWDGMYVGGGWERPEDRDVIPVENPANGDVVAEVPAGTAADVERAFDAATAAQAEWAEAPPQQRAQVVQGALHLLDQHGEEIAELLVAEAGSTRLKAGLELEEIAAGMMAESASFPMRAQGRQAESVIPGKDNQVRREPAGVVGVISPWNFPFHLSMRAVAPAIALGNSVVLKPAEDTPISGGLVHARLFEAAGLPEGVLNVVPGYGPEAGEAVAGHPDLDVLSFTGSTEVGRHVGKLAVENCALPALELGGNSPHVVLADADLDVAVDAGVFGSFMHQGQVCMAINRHVVHEDVYDEYVDRLSDRAGDLVVGNPADPETDVGPLINDDQVEQLMEYVEGTTEAGATVETGGGRDGRFVEPTVLSDVTNDMPAACNEQFGPVAAVIPVGSDEEAVEVANDTDRGLTASVQSRDLARAERVANAIDAGMVHVNDQPINDEPHIPFGGTKASGIGRYNADTIIDEFTEHKWISVQHEPREYPL